jgi:ribonucleotide reductase alpha subunit
MNMDMRVTKRDGTLEEIAFDKILNRIKKLGQEVGISLNYSALAMKVIDQLYDTISTTKIDELAAEQCASLSTNHPDYGTLASRIVISNHQKNTYPYYDMVVNSLYNFKNVHGEVKSLVSKEFFDFVATYINEIEAMIDYNRDYLIDYFGFKTLERAYLFKVNGKIVERPQHMWMRVAIGIHGDLSNGPKSLELIKETYDLMSQKYFTHATPTLFNAGTPRPQLSSCYLLGMEDDSIDGIFNTLKDCAHISKWAGGIGVHIHNVRAKGSHIQGTNGTSNGIVPMLRVFNNTARYVDQGGNKRNGSFSIYLEPWHPDVEDFLEMKKNHGDEELKARDLFYALWVPDLFMKRVKENGKWSYFCPNECPGLSDVYDEEFEKLYIKYEETEGKARKVVNARDLWFKILDAQMETGTPYILFKDAANKKSNQKNLGTIKSSNLCVAPDTFVLTDKGNVMIRDLEGKQVNVWNGEEFSEVVVFKTGTNQKIMEVMGKPSYSDRELFVIECTHYHKFYIQIEETTNVDGDKWQTIKSIKEIAAKDLKLGMRLIGCKMPSISDKKSYDYIEIVSLRDFGNKCDTYCFTEPKRNMGVFNGILTGQCTEIIEYSDKNETAVCNLASIALPAFVDPITKQFNYDKLHEVTKVVTNNLNKVIDINFYPTEKTKRSNLRHRPIGLGVQGLADTFILMDIAFHSEEAKVVNKLIAETMYHAALEKSNELAIEREQHIKESFLKLHNSTSFIIELPITQYNQYDQEYIFSRLSNRFEERLSLSGAYSTFIGSPASEGILQYDMWNQSPTEGRYDWQSLKQFIIKYGVRNSLLIAPMPTASTSQILGYNECFEPLTSNLYSRRTLAGEFVVTNKYLMKELIDMGLWNEKIKQNIIANKGSIQQLTILPEHIRNKYKIVWEMPMKHVIDMAADRGAFICQSQSLNLWVEDPTYNILTSMHFYSWNKGLKTGIYYLRRKAKHQAQQFTIEPDKKTSSANEEICEMCSA